VIGRWQENGGRKIVTGKVGGDKTVDRTVDRIDKKMGDKKMTK
jgi:hypothetical protein